MRTLEELRAIAMHPAGRLASEEETPENDVASSSDTPYRAHFDALEQLKDAILLHGTGSLEAQVCRRRVDRTRDAALRAWKQSQVAAA
ncbi:MAG: hypothetical protein WD826_08020 [Actinomycetota bacterium]